MHVTKGRPILKIYLNYKEAEILMELAASCAEGQGGVGEEFCDELLEKLHEQGLPVPGPDVYFHGTVETLGGTS